MKWKLAAVFLLAGLIAAAGLISTASAQRREGGKGKVTTVETRSQRARGEAAQDENIKSTSVKNDPAARMEAPPNKGGTRTRGGFATIHVDNHTQWKIQIYIDGDYGGLVGGYGDLYRNTGAGRTVLYGRADFTDGSVKTWGPRTVNLESGETFTWQLYD